MVYVQYICEMYIIITFYLFQVNFSTKSFLHKVLYVKKNSVKTLKDKSIIDYIISTQYTKLKLYDMRVYRDAECTSDPWLVQAKLFFSWDNCSEKTDND